MEFEPIPRPCDAGSGDLPSCAPLAVPYVPFQPTDTDRYSQTDALAAGTLFPGLNLPFHLKTEPSTLAESAVLELQALDFVLDELSLYLDTHSSDQEAFQLYRQYSKLAKEGRQRYQAKYGPLTKLCAAQTDRYTWLNDPWPWEYEQSGGER